MMRKYIRAPHAPVSTSPTMMPRPRFSLKSLTTRRKTKKVPRVARFPCAKLAIPVDLYSSTIAKASSPYSRPRPIPAIRDVRRNATCSTPWWWSGRALARPDHRDLLVLECTDDVQRTAADVQEELLVNAHMIRRTVGERPDLGSDGDVVEALQRLHDVG